MAGPGWAIVEDGIGCDSIGADGGGIDASPGAGGRGVIGGFTGYCSALVINCDGGGTVRAGRCVRVFISALADSFVCDIFAGAISACSSGVTGMLVENCGVGIGTDGGCAGGGVDVAGGADGVAGGVMELVEPGGCSA